jgi:hypothetical protein
MHKKTLAAVIVLICFLVCTVSLIFVSRASAQVGDKFIVSLQSNGGWVINKTTRKVMFFKYTRKATVWKSSLQILPADIDLDNCVLQSVGDAAFLYDKSSGVIRFYKPLKDGSLMPFPYFNLEAETK